MMSTVSTVPTLLCDLGVIFLLLCGVGDLLPVVRALRMHRLNVPRTAHVGDSLWLNCSYDLETDDLYAVNWHFNNTEFYSFKNNKPNHFDVAGISTDREASNGSSVLLINVSLQGEGLYRCEVTAGRPTFQTVAMDHYLEVYMMPTSPPAIVGARAAYSVGDVANVTCQSALSKPATRLSWRINNKPAPVSALVPYAPLPASNGLQYSLLGLIVKLEPPLVNSGDSQLRLTCYAEVRREKQIQQHVKVTMPKGSSSVEENPIIAYSQQHDVLNASCIVRDSSDASDITWFLNGKKLDTNNTRRLETYMRVHPSLSVKSDVSVHLQRSDRIRPLLRCVAVQAHALWNATKVRTLKMQARSAGYFFLNGAPSRATSLLSLEAFMLLLIQFGISVLTRPSPL